MAMAQTQFEDLYRRMAGLVARRCERWLGDRAESEDLAQEVFVRAYRYDSYSGSGSMIGWLFRIADRLCIDALRRRKRWDEQSAGVLGVQVKESLGARDVSAPVLLLSRLVHACRPEILEVGMLAHLDGLGQEAIAEHVGVSRKTIGKRLALFHHLAQEVLEGLHP